MSKRKGGCSKRSVVKRSSLGGFLEACRTGKRHVTPRKAALYVPRNGVKVDTSLSDERLLKRAMAEAKREEQLIRAGHGHAGHNAGAVQRMMCFLENVRDEKNAIRKMNG